MSDIAKCEGTNCPIKETCYRFKAIPNEYYQSYFMEIPFKDGKCDYYDKILNVYGTVDKVINKNELDRILFKYSRSN